MVVGEHIVVVVAVVGECVVGGVAVVGGYVVVVEMVVGEYVVVGVVVIRVVLGYVDNVVVNVNISDADVTAVVTDAVNG